MKKKYIVFSIIIMIGVSAFAIKSVNGNNKEVTMSETKNLMDEMPATDYERNLDKTKDLLNMYNSGTLDDNSKLATIQNASRDIPVTKSISSDEENAKIKLSSCYRAYKKGTLNYNILCSSIESDITALNIDLEGAKIYQKDNNTLILKIENCISVCEQYLEKARIDENSNTGDVNKLYEEYDKTYTDLKNEINNLF